MYIKIVDNLPQKYSIRQLKTDNPQISFPNTITDSILSEYGLYPLIPTEYPSYDRLTQNLLEGTPIQVNDKWVQTWIVQEASYEEIEQRKAEELFSQKMQRAAAYREEADPIFFKAQRGESTIQEWENKVQEIRDRYPYISE